MQLYPTPQNPAPEGAIAVAVKTRDGVSLRGLTALTPEARGTVVVIGGRGDFMERYFETMRDLMAHGLTMSPRSIFAGRAGPSARLPIPIATMCGISPTMTRTCGPS